ncbi:hypothetical protein BSA16_26850 [Micromonospora sp. Rc5]|nr:hypothetical protein BSA16_26850 [Micromonospora sp. Rc5]
MPTAVPAEPSGLLRAVPGRAGPVGPDRGPAGHDRLPVLQVSEAAGSPADICTVTRPGPAS